MMKTKSCQATSAQLHHIYREAGFLKCNEVHFHMEPRPQLSMSAVDNFSAGKLATEHLAGQGYQHIGIVTRPLTWREARERLGGWRSVLVETNLDAEIDVLIVRLQTKWDTQRIGIFS